MASSMSIILLAIVLPTVAMAAEYTVGDKSGWTVNYNYADWAKDKVFYVGDKLTFTYNPSKHNVYKVDGTVFNSCSPPANNQPLNTGNDTITLAAPGKKWYICGVADHCAKQGMKLVINVEATVPAPSPVPNPGTNSGFHVSSSVSQIIIGALLFVVMIVV